MKLISLLSLFVLAVLTARAVEPAKPAAQPVPGVEIGIEQKPGEQLNAARTDGTGVATIKVAQAGTYTVVVQPLSKSRTGNYSRARMNPTPIAISGGTKPASGSYNLTGAEPCRIEVVVGHSATLTIRISPPPQPVRDDYVKPAIQ